MKMRHVLFGWVAICTVGCANLRLPEADYDAGLSRQILVTTRQNASVAQGLVGDPATVYLRRPGYGPVARVNRLLDEIAEEFGIERIDGWMISSLGVYCEVYELVPGQDRDEILRRLESDPRVESAQTMNVYETEGVTYDDPYVSMQPALSELSIDLAHELATGRGVIVAVIDSLVDDRHPEIRGRVPVREDLVRDRKPASRAEIHGTAVAGVIASKANNAEGIVGVAPETSIESLRACWTVDESSGRALCSSFSLARALEEALRSGVDVVNLSLSGPRDPLVERLIDAAIEDGVIVVAALPDARDSTADFPASHPGVIAAAAPDVDVSSMVNVLRAPATEILSTVPGSGYAFFSGNSMSSAFIAGVTALLVERRPGLSAGEVLALLTETSESGSINACRAISRLSTADACRPAISEVQARDREP